MALENARLDQVFSKALSLFANGSVPVWPTGYRDDGTALPFRCRYASRSEPVSRYAAHASYAGSLSGVRLSQGRWVSVIRRALLLVNHDLQILSDGPAFGGRARRVVRDHAGGVGPVGAKGADRLRGAVLQIPHVGGVPLLVCFRGPHGEQHAVAVAGVRHVTPFQARSLPTAAARP